MKAIDNADHVSEIVFNDREIEEMIRQLEKLKKTKSNTTLEFGDAAEIVIHHEDDELLKFKKEKQSLKVFDVRTKTSNFLGRFSRKNKK